MRGEAEVLLLLEVGLNALDVRLVAVYYDRQVGLFAGVFTQPTEDQLH